MNDIKKQEPPQLNAEARAFAERALRGMGKAPHPAPAAKKPEKKAASAGALRTFGARLVGGRFSLKDQVFFAKRMAFLINAGVPLLESLTILREQAGKGRQGKILEQLVRDVSQGQSLSRSMAKFSDVFSEFAIHIVKVGESTGTLAQNLQYLADELKKRQALKRKIVGAFVYPAVITVATLGITAFLMLYLFPKIMPIFASLHTELPVTTRMVMATSIFLQHWGIEFVVAVILGFLLTSFLVKQIRPLRFFVHWTLLRLPLLGGVTQHYNVANGTRTLGLMLKSGVKLSEALVITADTTKNLAYRGQYMRLCAVVDKGEQMSTYLRKHPACFPEILSHMVAVGERSGTLSETLVYLSEIYEGEVDDFTKNLSTLIEPALMVFMGVLVGFVAISIITPIYGITQSLHA